MAMARMAGVEGMEVEGVEHLSTPARCHPAAAWAHRRRPARRRPWLGRSGRRPDTGVLAGGGKYGRVTEWRLGWGYLPSTWARTKLGVTPYYF